MHNDTDFRGTPLPQPDCPAILVEVRTSSGVPHNLRRFRVGEVVEDPGIRLRPRFVHTSFGRTGPLYCLAAEIACVLLRRAAVPHSRVTDRDPKLRCWRGYTDMEDRCETGSRNRDVRQAKTWRGHPARPRQRTTDKDAHFTIYRKRPPMLAPTITRTHGAIFQN